MPKSTFLFILIILLSYNCLSAQNSKKNKDIDIIKQVIEREVNALNRDHNLVDYLSCFANSDKVQVGPSNDKMTIGYAAIKVNAEKVIENYNGEPNPNTWSFADWDVRVNGNTAFASCLQTTKTAQGTFIDVYKSDYFCFGKRLCFNC